MSPTACLTAAWLLYRLLTAGCRGEVYPGWCRGGVYPGWGWEGYTGYYPGPIPGTHIELILASEPYPRPNEGKFKVIDEVS